MERLKLLVEPLAATSSDWLDLHGMQEVRGSNPRSSTFFRVDVREKVTNSSHLEPADLAPPEGCPHA